MRTEAPSSHEEGAFAVWKQGDILLLCIIEEGFIFYIFVTLKTLFYEIFAKMLSFLDFSS